MSDVIAAGREFLFHYGIKGMRWGHRGGSARTVETSAVVGAGLRGKTKVKAKGGENHPASKDAIKAAEKKQKLKKSGTAALSNQELQELATRMQLEVNVKRLDQETSSGGKKFVKSLVKDNAARTARTEVQGIVERSVAEAKAKQRN